MSTEDSLKQRSGNICELCGSADGLTVYNAFEDGDILVCNKCESQILKREPLDIAHWSCLNTSMWSEVPAVQIVSWRMLSRLRDQTWAQEALDMMYLSDDDLAIAKSTGDNEDSGELEFHKDSNGAILQNGDSVTLIKTLDVKGSSLSAKVGTSVKNIRLVHDNVEQIEGKIDGQQIVILTKYVKKG